MLNLYSELIYSVQGLIQEIDWKKEDKIGSKIDTIHLITAKLKVLVSSDIIIKIEDFTAAYNEYIEIHFQNKPKKIGDTILLSSTEKSDFEAEKEKWESMSRTVDELVKTLKGELERL